MTNAHSIACELLTFGYSVIPSGAGPNQKAPAVSWKNWQMKQPNKAQVEKWALELNPKLWGIVTNHIIGVVEADTPEALAELTAKLGQPNVLSPRGGGHFYIDTLGHPLKTAAGILPGMDVRGVGGFINIAGSSRFGEYKILKLPIPGELMHWSQLPEYILAAMKESKSGLKAKQGTPIPESKRNTTLTSLAGTMRRKGITQEAIEAALRATPCDPPLPEDELKKIAASVCRYEPAKPTAETREDIINLIRAFTGQANTIPIPRVLIDFFTGDYPSAILCNQLLYWQGKEKRTDGGIYKSYKDWKTEIGLSEYQVRRAANKLKKRGFLKTRLHKADTGAPTVHYYFNVTTFSDSFLEFLQNPILSISRIHGEETKESLTENTS